MGSMADVSAVLRDFQDCSKGFIMCFWGDPKSFRVVPVSSRGFWKRSKLFHEFPELFHAVSEMFQ